MLKTVGRQVEEVESGAKARFQEADSGGADFSASLLALLAGATAGRQFRASMPSDIETRGYNPVRPSAASSATPRYDSCFISHSFADLDFVKLVCGDLESNGVTCWYAPRDMHGGQILDQQITDAIRMHNRFLLVLSANSIRSNWVKREITKAVRREDQERERFLFPIRLIAYSELRDWEYLDDRGRDLAQEIRRFYIPDFRSWKTDHAAYQEQFDRLLHDLRSTATAGAEVT